MKKEEFFLKEITFKGEYGISVIRSRNSNGYAGIKLILKGAEKTQSIEINTGNYSDNYEQVALEISRVMGKAADEPCILPAGTKMAPEPDPE